MPCICYGAKSGNEEYNEFIESPKGQEALEHISKAASIIMSHRIDLECDLSPFDFRQMFVKCFLHMMIGCDEEEKPKLMDKSSTTYFMTEMTQKEFEERAKGKEKVNYQFNKIRRGNVG